VDAIVHSEAKIFYLSNNQVYGANALLQIFEPWRFYIDTKLHTGIDARGSDELRLYRSARSQVKVVPIRWRDRPRLRNHRQDPKRVVGTKRGLVLFHHKPRDVLQSVAREFSLKRRRTCSHGMQATAPLSISSTLR